MFGAFYDTRKFGKLSDASIKERGNYGLYWHLEQTVYREGTEGDQGLLPWLSVTLFPDEAVSTFPFFIAGGAVYEGLFYGRDRDKTAVGFAYGKVSDDLLGKDYETMFELTYIFQATDWFQVQPDFLVYRASRGIGRDTKCWCDRTAAGC